MITRTTVLSNLSGAARCARANPNVSELSNLFANILFILDTDIKNGIAQDEMIEAVYAGTAEGLLKAVLV